MLRRADTNKPILHMVYEMWDSMIEKVKKVIFKYEGIDESERSDFYDVIHSILVDRWAKSCTPLHYMTLSLNSKCYTQQWINEAPNHVPPHKDDEICVKRNKCLKSFFPNVGDRTRVNVEYAKFSGYLEQFGEFDSLEDWWRL